MSQYDYQSQNKQAEQPAYNAQTSYQYPNTSYPANVYQTNYNYGTSDDYATTPHRLGAWKFTFLKLLFAIPIVGFVFLIVFSFNSSNMVRRSFARSYWTDMLIFGAVGLVIFIILMICGVSVASLVQTSSYRYY